MGARDLPQPAEEHAQPCRVDELDRGQVEHHGRLPALDRVVQAHAELRRGRDVDLAGHGDDMRAVVELLL